MPHAQNGTPPPQQSLFDGRDSGILLHPSSLPGNSFCGQLDHHALHFVDFLHDCGFHVWQTLPLTEPRDHLSPYDCISVYAGNPALISLQALVADGWLPPSTPIPKDLQQQMQLLRNLFADRLKVLDKITKQQMEAFYQEQCWLRDYALFVAIKKKTGNKSWYDWDEPLKTREPSAMANIAKTLADDIEFNCFVQFIFHRQWTAVKHYANDKGIVVVGDMPFFCGMDSADVWTNPSLFKLKNHKPTVVVGVPPDYFSGTGQLWGNPAYNWSALEKQHFSWWADRFKHAQQHFDAVRIDHFRGFDACWEVACGSATAENGKWVKAPGRAILALIKEQVPDLILIAEDLGTITNTVHQLRNDYHIPGMGILQFAFDGNASNPYLPHHHTPYSVIYTGTHDNNTTLGWFNALDQTGKSLVMNYYAWPQEFMPWPLIKSALQSTASLAILPMQDALLLDSEARMNTPGTTEGNWVWRFQWETLKPDIKKYLLELNALYDRLSGTG
jgi:4-alpha-glucanotransferase